MIILQILIGVILCSILLASIVYSIVKYSENKVPTRMTIKEEKEYEISG